MALVHYYGGLQDKGWLAWREVVEMSELERGGGARKQLVYRRWGTWWGLGFRDWDLVGFRV